MYVFWGYINSTEMSVCLRMISQCIDVKMSALLQGYLRGVYLKYHDYIYVLFSRTDLLMRILSYKDLENPPNYDSGGSPGLYQTKQK